MKTQERGKRVLVVDDDLGMAETVADGLVEHGFEAFPVADTTRALAAIEDAGYDALVADLRIPGSDGLTLLAKSRARAPESPVIVMTAFSAVDTAVESIRRGAYHYLTKPFKQDELAIFLGRALDEVRLKRETSALKSALRTRYSASKLLGNSPPIRAVRERIERVADAPAPVIVLG